MRNNNQKVIRRLSQRSMKHSRMRNLFAVAAITLTCMLFTVLASMGIGMMQVTQEQTMREVGTKAHAGLKNVTKEQMDRIVADDRVKSYSWNILVGRVENVIRRNGEIRLAQGEEELENSFIELAEGTLPQAEDDIVADTIVMDELGVPHQLGEKMTLEFSFLGETVTKTFTVCGWYEGDRIGMASQLYVSQAYWDALRNGMTDEDFAAWGKENVSENGTGLYQVNLYFENARNIEERVLSVIRDAGYEPETEINYGVNWAYMTNRAENIDFSSALLLGAAAVIVLVTGYLIIYNIFQISITQDIRFYGLLKTLGTTKRQLQRLIRRQALLLSLAGIPLGLLLGFFIGKVLFPFAMSVMNMGGMKITLRFHPAILLFGAVFSLITVLLGCRKPGKIAGSVSPVEAVRYSEGTLKRKKEKHSEKGARVHRMAMSNLGRNKKKTVLVILSLSLSLTLLCVVITGVDSFQLDSYLQSRLIGDVAIGSLRYTLPGSTEPGTELDDAMAAYLDAQPGIAGSYEMYTTTYPRTLFLDEEAARLYAGWRDQGLLRTGDDWSDMAIANAAENGEVETDVYGYDTGLLDYLTVVEGELDPEKFQEGGYVLLTSVVGDHTEDCYLYHPGDKVTIGNVSPYSEAVEVTDENGNLLNIRWTNLEEKEYEVMAIVDIPTSMDLHSYSVNGVGMVLPKSELTKSYGDEGEYTAGEDYGYRFAKTYTVEEDALDAFIQAAESYVEGQNPYMGYISKETLEQEFSGMVTVIRTLGLSLGIVIAVIGVLNFVNSVLTGIVARKREFAILSSIGMTDAQLRRMLLEESLYYVAISGVIGIVLGSLAGYGVLSALNQVILFFSYRYNAAAFLIMLPLFTVAAVLIPYAGYGRLKKESIVERLRDAE